MDHYEVRKYTGWHHHMLTTMLAHFFLWHLKIHLGEKALRSQYHRCGHYLKWCSPCGGIETRGPRVHRLEAAA